MVKKIDYFNGEKTNRLDNAHMHIIKTVKSEDVKPGPPKRRGRRPKKIVDQCDVSSALQPVSQDNESAVILNLPIPFNQSFLKHLKHQKLSCVDKPVVDKPLVSLNDTLKNLSLHNNDIFNNDIPNDQSCYMCSKLEKRVEILKEKLDKYEKKESFDQSTKIYSNKIKIIHSDGKKQTSFQKTNIKCWWDCHSFDTVPCVLPEQYHNNTYYVTGCFCSFNCALAYNLYFLKDSKIYLRKSLVYKMYRELHSLSTSDTFEIREASPKEILKDFGGVMSIDKYRKTFDLNKDYILYTSFVKPISISVEERNSTNSEYNDEKKYVLKRVKPLQKKTNVINTMTL